MELITGLVGVVVGAVLSYVLQRRGGRRDRRCDVARQFVELAPRVLSGEAARRRSEYEDRVRRIVDDARLLGSRDLADAADIVSNAFRRKEQPPGNIVGLAQLIGAIDYVARRDCGQRMKVRERVALGRQHRAMIRRERRNFAEIAAQQLVKRMVGEG